MYFIVVIKKKDRNLLSKYKLLHILNVQQKTLIRLQISSRHWQYAIFYIS